MEYSTRGAAEAALEFLQVGAVADVPLAVPFHHQQAFGEIGGVRTTGRTQALEEVVGVLPLAVDLDPGAVRVLGRDLCLRGLVVSEFAEVDPGF
jgi:hypothetical protein